MVTGEEGVSTRSVTVTGVDIPFWDLVKLQVKFAVAAIPAALILIALVVLAKVAIESL